MTTIEVLQEEFESIKAELVQRYNELGMKSSGLWESELEISIDGDESKSSSKVLGLNYTEQLVFGRKPGKFPPIKAIEQWIQDKGIAAIGKNISTSSLAFLIARKIAQEGTNYFKQGGTDLVESVITPERIQSIIDRVKEINVVTMTNGLIEKLKQVA